MYKFKLVGLQKIDEGNDVIAICEPLDKEESFHAILNMSIDRKFALWALLKNNWGGVTCRLSFTKTFHDIPKDAVLEEIYLPTTN